MTDLSLQFLMVLAEVGAEGCGGQGRVLLSEEAYIQVVNLGGPALDAAQVARATEDKPCILRPVRGGLIGCHHDNGVRHGLSVLAPVHRGRSKVDVGDTVMALWLLVIIDNGAIVSVLDDAVSQSACHPPSRWESDCAWKYGMGNRRLEKTEIFIRDLGHFIFFF